MPHFRHNAKVKEYYVEYGWKGTSYYKSPVSVMITEKKGDKYEIVEELGDFNYEKKQAKEGYKFVSTLLGEVIIKFARKLLILEKIVVTVNGGEVKGNEVVNFTSVAGEIGEVS